MIVFRCDLLIRLGFIIIDMLTKYLVHGLALRATPSRRRNQITTNWHAALECATSVARSNAQRGILLIHIGIHVVIPSRYIRMCVHDCSS